MKRWILYLIMVLVVVAVLDYYFIAKLTPPLDLPLPWKSHGKQPPASVTREQEAPEEILALRQRHHLRALMDIESGTRAREIAKGTYGFAACDVQSVNATRTNDSALEIHKHLDGILYYVGYASEDQVEKYLTRQKNFHILVSLKPRAKASSLFEIPVDFVSKCTMSPGGEGSLFDLFVTAIPELQS
jgi:hypothetical protein